MFDNLMYLISGVSIIAPPVIFVVFLINALIHIHKYKKGTEGKGKLKRVQQEIRTDIDPHHARREYRSSGRQDHLHGRRKYHKR